MNHAWHNMNYLEDVDIGLELLISMLLTTEA